MEHLCLDDTQVFVGYLKVAIFAFLCQFGDLYMYIFILYISITVIFMDYVDSLQLWLGHQF